MAAGPPHTSDGNTTDEHDVSIKAAKNWTLHGRLFQSQGQNNGPAIIMSGAAAVPAGYYHHYARALLAAGAQSVLCYDYRGIARSAGDRKHWRSLKMADWAHLDLTAAIAWMNAKYPGHPLVGCGHSYGGQAPGLCPAASAFVRYGTVATMSGYFAKTDQPVRVWAQTQLFGRPIAALLGQVPKPISVGEAMPGGIMLDWARWIASRNYFFDDPKIKAINGFDEIKMPFLAVHVEDDVWGTRSAILDFLRHYTATDVRLLTIKPGASGPMGHLGFFRRAHKETHWPQLTHWLIDGTMPAGTESVSQAAFDLSPPDTV
ncbi:MAG: alpha/beta fold hydrolase [Pseudomonadota bacterium]